MVRISTLNLNNVNAAISHRQSILEMHPREELTIDKTHVRYSIDEDAKTIHALTQRLKILTNDEKDELEAKYEGGMTMAALANEYGCHYTTVGRILRSRNVSTSRRNE